MRLLIAFGLVLIGCGPTPSGTETGQHSTSREIRIAAASDLKFAVDEIVEEFEKRNRGIRVRVSYGSSGNYYAQLSNQAPFDVFLSADVEFPRRLSRQGLTLPESEFAYAVGRIVIWVPASSPIDVEKLEIASLRHPSVTRIAIANPQHAPYGRAAEAAMRSSGVYEAVRSKIVLGENIAQTMQFIQSGNTEIGIVALSLAVAPRLRGQGRYWEIPLDRYPRMEQGGVILKWAKDPDAAKTFRAFLMEPGGRAILKKFGFILPEG
jgi:molybdate transport system substrate-binding protein